MKRWWYFALLVVVSSAASATIETATQVFKQVSPSVVVVLTYDAAGKATELGSGVALPSGDVATNCHVLKDGTQYRVRYRGRDFVAHLHFSDWNHDVCSLSVADLKAPPVTLGDTKTVNVGDPVYAIGTPEGLDLTLSQGIVSSLRQVKDGSYIQTTAAISPGSSGGGLFDDQGRLLGLTSFNVTKGQQLNFALPVEWIEALPQHSTKQQAARGTTEISFFARAATLESQRDGTGFLRLANEWAAAFPHSANAWGAVAEGNFMLARYPDAIVAARHAVQLDRKNPMGWSMLGKAYGSVGKYEQAIRADEQLLRINPSYEQGWIDLSFSYFHTQQFMKEAGALKHALQINPNDENVWFTLGTSYSFLTLYPQSVDAFRHALVLNPKDADAWWALGMAYNALGKSQQVTSIYQRLESLSPSRANDLFNCCILPH